MSNPVTAEKRPQTESRTDGRSFLTPRVNILETKDGYRLEAEMPGVDKSGLDVTLEANELTITGRRTPYATEGATRYRESQPLDFRRVFELDPAINTSNIKARIEQGVLTLELPKSEQVKPKKIAVTD